MANDKEQLILELRALLAQDDVMSVKDQVEQLKMQFYRAYNQQLEADRDAALAAAQEQGIDFDWQPEVDPLELQFKDMLSQYKQKRADFAAKREAELQSNLARKEAILSQMKALAESETADVMDNLQLMRQLQADWKTIGPVPATHTQDMWKLKQQYQDAFYDLVKINIELRDLDFKKNFDLKTKLCEQAELLQASDKVVEASRILQQLHEEWAEIGPVAREVREELWQRFKAASTAIHKKHQAYFDAIHAQEEENLAKKQALIDTIASIDCASLHTIEQWAEATERVQAIQAEWRTIGYAPRKSNQSIFDTYRAALDAFFQAKGQFFTDLRARQAESRRRQAASLATKKELVARANELKESTDWKTTTDAFLAMQEEWKKTGGAPRKQSDELWAQFREACDFFFNAKREANQAAHADFERRRSEAKANFSKRIEQTDRQRLEHMRDRLRQDIQTAENNILFFTSTSKSGNSLLNTMRSKISALKDQLSEVESKLSSMD